MENARIALFEDSEDTRFLMTRVLSNLGHEVVAQLATMEESRGFIDGLEDDVIDVAIVDGNLDSGSLDSSDGAEIAGLLRAKTSTFIIGRSGTNDVEGAHINLTKGSSPDLLFDAIAGL